MILQKLLWNSCGEVISVMCKALQKCNQEVTGYAPSKQHGHVVHLSCTFLYSSLMSLVVHYKQFPTHTINSAFIQ